MKKFLCFFFVFLISVYSLFILDPYEIKADAAEYSTYAEIMMVNGKLVSNFTADEKKEVLSKFSDWPEFFGYQIVYAYTNEKATYMSATLYSFENQGKTAITHEYNITTERSKTTTFKFTGSISGASSGTIKKIKAEAAAKAGIEYTETSTESEKDIKKTNFVIDPGTRGIIYLEGNLTVTNGAVRIFYFFNKSYEGFFEVVVIGDQFPRFEVKPV